METSIPSQGQDANRFSFALSPETLAESEFQLDEAPPGLSVAAVGAPAQVPLLAGVEEPALANPAEVLCENVLCLHLHLPFH